MKRKVFVTTNKIMSRQIPKAKGHEKLVENRLGVATQGILVMTRIRLLNKIYVATLSKYVATQSKTKPKEQVTTENKKLQQRQRQRLKALSRQNFLCLDKETNFGQNFGDPQCNL